jgi:hypothetical protein
MDSLLFHGFRSWNSVSLIWSAFAAMKGCILLDGLVCSGRRLFDKTMLSFLVVSYKHRFIVRVTCTAEVQFNED